MKKILLSAIVLCAVISGAAQFGNISPDRKLAITEKLIETYYVSDVDTTKVVDEAIKAMLKQLDPHSAYSTPEETRDLNEPLQGNFSGIGIQFGLIDDTLHVVQTIAGGPSEKVGILAGDRILSADDSLLTGAKRTNADIRKFLRGPKGTEVDLVIKRRGEDAPIAFRVIRDDIPIYSVDASFMATPTVGYIRISRFAEETTREVEEALASLRRQGMTDLIIDLQSNGGGYLIPAQEIAAMFLKKGDPIVATRGDRVDASEYITQRDGQMVDKGRVIVLVDQYSASASEILSGALQDNDRGIIVGRRTFGKGLVQRPFPFPDGSMIRLTIARYYTPSGRCIQKPYTAGDNEAYAHDLIDRYTHGELSNIDSVKIDETEIFHTLKRNRPVYGGGGIMPDVFVAVDTTFWTPYYRDLMAKGLLRRLATEYLDSERDNIKTKFPTEDAFVEGFEVDDSLISRLMELGERNGVAADTSAMATSGPTIRRILKAAMASDLFTPGAYYRVSVPEQDHFIRAMELLNNPEEYERILAGQKPKK